MTNLIDIYEAAGGTVSEDRSHVTIDGQNKPFKIELLVVPTGIETMNDEPTRVTFQILLHDEYVHIDGLLGANVRKFQYLEELTLPVTQVKIIKEDS